MSEKIIQNVQVNVDLKFNKDIAGLKGQVEKAVQSNLKAAGVNELLDSKAVILKSAVQGTARNLQTVERTSARLQNHLWDTEKNIIASNKSISELKGHFATVEGNIKNAVVGSDRWNDHYKQLDKIAIAIRNEEQNLLNLNKKQAGLIESRTRNENKRLDFSTKSLRQEQQGVQINKARNENNQKILKTSDKIRELTAEETKLRNDYVSQVAHLLKATKMSAYYQDQILSGLYATNSADFKKVISKLPATSVINAWGTGATQERINKLTETTSNSMAMSSLKAHGKMLERKERDQAKASEITNKINIKDNIFEQQLSKLRIASSPFELRQAGNIYTRQAARTSLMPSNSDKAVNFNQAAIQYKGNIEKTLLDPNTKISLNDFRVLTRRYNDLVYHHGGMIDAGVKTILKEKEHSLKQLDLLDQRNKLVQQSAVTGFYDTQKIGHIEKQLGVGAYGASGAIPTQKYTYTSGKGLGIDENYQGAGKKLLQGITNQLDAGLVNISPGYAKKLVARQEELLHTRDVAMYRGQGHSLETAKAMAQSPSAVATRTTQANALTATRLSTGSEALIGTMGVAGIAAGTIAVTALGTAFALAIVQANKFETALADLGGVSSYSEKQIKQFSQSARILSVNTTFGATETMRSLTELSKLGYTMEQAGTMVGAVQRSAALAGVSMESSANMIGEIVHQFGLTAASATGISDTMAAAFNSSALDFGKLEQSLKYAGPLAAIAGANFRETAAALGVMADQGINASMAGTSMRKFFTVINKEGSKSQKALKELGLETAPLELQMKALSKVFDTQAKVQKEFGIQASSGILAVFNKIGHEATDAANGIKTFSESFDAITKDNSGLALELMLKKTNTIAGQWERMKTNLEELAISSASDTGIVGVFKSLVGLSADLVGNLAKVSNLRGDEKIVKDIEDQIYNIRQRGSNNPLKNYNIERYFNELKDYSIGKAIGKDHLDIDYIKQKQEVANRAYALGDAKFPQLIGGIRESQTATGMSLLDANVDFNLLKESSAKANNLANAIYRNQLELNSLSKNKVKWSNEDILRNATLNDAVYNNKKKLADQEELIMKEYVKYGFNMEDPKNKNSMAAILFRGKALRTESINPKTGFDPLETTQRQLDSDLKTAQLNFQIGDLFKATRDRTIATEKKKKGGDEVSTGGGKTQSSLPSLINYAEFFQPLYTKARAESESLQAQIEDFDSELLGYTAEIKKGLKIGAILAKDRADFTKANTDEFTNLAQKLGKDVLTVGGTKGQRESMIDLIHKMGSSSSTSQSLGYLDQIQGTFSEKTLKLGKRGAKETIEAYNERIAQNIKDAKTIELQNALTFNKEIENSKENQVRYELEIEESLRQKALLSNKEIVRASNETIKIGQKSEFDTQWSRTPLMQRWNPFGGIMQEKATTVKDINIAATLRGTEKEGRDRKLAEEQKRLAGMGNSSSVMLNLDGSLSYDNEANKKYIEQKKVVDEMAASFAELDRLKKVADQGDTVAKSSASLLQAAKIHEQINAAGVALAQIGDAQVAWADYRHQRRMEQIEAEKQAEINGINHQQAMGIVSSRAAQRQIASAEKRAEAAKIESFNRDKGMKIAMIRVNEALAISGAIAGAMQMAAVTGGIGIFAASGIAAAQIALIVAQNELAVTQVRDQKYATGGFPSGKDARITVNERGQEAVLNATATARLGRSTINDLNAGKSASFGGNSNQNQTINITYAPVMSFGANTNETSLRRVASDERRIFAEKMKDVTKRGYIS